MINEASSDARGELWDAAEHVTTARLAYIEVAAARRDDSGARRARLQEIVDRARKQALLDERNIDDIIGYDEHGLPG